MAAAEPRVGRFGETGRGGEKSDVGAEGRANALGLDGKDRGGGGGADREVDDGGGGAGGIFGGNDEGAATGEGRGAREHAGAGVEGQAGGQRGGAKRRRAVGGGEGEGEGFADAAARDGRSGEHGRLRGGDAVGQLGVVDVADEHLVTGLFAEANGGAGIGVGRILGRIIEGATYPDGGAGGEALGLGETIHRLPVEIVLGDAQQNLAGAVGVEGVEAHTFTAVVHVRVKLVEYHILGGRGDEGSFALVVLRVRGNGKCDIDGGFGGELTGRRG